MEDEKKKLPPLQQRPVQIEESVDQIEEIVSKVGKKHLLTSLDKRPVPQVELEEKRDIIKDLPDVHTEKRIEHRVECQACESKAKRIQELEEQLSQAKGEIERLKAEKTELVPQSQPLTHLTKGRASGPRRLNQISKVEEESEKNPPLPEKAPELEEKTEVVSSQTVVVSTTPDDPPVSEKVAEKSIEKPADKPVEKPAEDALDESPTKVHSRKPSMMGFNPTGGTFDPSKVKLRKSMVVGQQSVPDESKSATYLTLKLGETIVMPLQDSLKDGQVLCKLINTIKNDTIIKINTQKFAFVAKQNIAKFLEEAEKMGVPKHLLFGQDDIENGKMSNVFQTLDYMAMNL